MAPTLLPIKIALALCLMETAATLTGGAPELLRCRAALPYRHRDPIPLRFDEATSMGLVLTDARLSTVAGSSPEALQAEAASRWDLLEAAFAMYLPATAYLPSTWLTREAVPR